MQKILGRVTTAITMLIATTESAIRAVKSAVIRKGKSNSEFNLLEEIKRARQDRDYLYSVFNEVTDRSAIDSVTYQILAVESRLALLHRMINNQNAA
jgi:hypothetical protein